MRYRHLLAMFAFMCAASTHAADWPRYHGPDNNGISKETGPPQVMARGRPEDSVAKAARHRLLVDFGRPRPRLYHVSGRAKQYVACFDEKTGKRAVEGPDRPDFRRLRQSRRPACTPTVDGDFVYALDGNGELVCLRAADGKVKWRKTSSRWPARPTSNGAWRNRPSSSAIS